MSSMTAPHSFSFSGISLKGFGARSLAAVAVSLVFVVAGSVFIVMGFQAKGTVRDTLAQEKITLTGDAPQLVPGAVAGATVDSAKEAEQMADVIRHHTLSATGGLVYAEMGRYLTPSGKSTEDVKLAAKDAKTGQPVENTARNIWVTSTTWRSALMQAEMGFKLADFVAGLGALLIVAGLGFGVVGVRREKKATA